MKPHVGIPSGRIVLTVRFRGVNTSQRLRLIASTPEFLVLPVSSFSGVSPNFLVHTGVFLPVFSVTRRTARTLPLYE